MREMSNEEVMQVSGGGIYNSGNRQQLRDMAVGAIAGGIMGGPIGAAVGLIAGSITGFRRQTSAK
ncbi:Blp family class II bacteriocin [Stenotrophomonas rhizophila]|uniref:Blp family class II bacteriocin n=1 Tax=Stenotrophomonas rhizophila TaxID=216778 RepID=UPI00119D5DE1|nr:Blp family class II bacteriocin [Stenotrophomonas rhizophila]